MFGHQTMFDRVWSPNIFRLDRALECAVTPCFLILVKYTLVFNGIDHAIKGHHHHYHHHRQQLYLLCTGDSLYIQTGLINGIGHAIEATVIEWVKFIHYGDSFFPILFFQTD